jgi:hypothetical protein
MHRFSESAVLARRYVTVAGTDGRRIIRCSGLAMASPYRHPPAHGGGRNSHYVSAANLRAR